MRTMVITGIMRGSIAVPRSPRQWSRPRDRPFPLHLPHAPGDPTGSPEQLPQMRHDAGASDARAERG